MNAQDTAAALASALPAGIKYEFQIMGGEWRADKIAEFQAERLAESGYVLTYVDSEEVR